MNIDKQNYLKLSLLQNLNQKSSGYIVNNKRIFHILKHRTLPYSKNITLNKDSSYLYDGSSIDVARIDASRGEPLRHFIPSTREWKHSVYSYNRNIFKTALIRNRLATNKIKSYFNLTSSKVTTFKSKRMRILIRRSSTKKMFVSKPEIKETNDKVALTVYTVDNDNKNYHRKIVLANKSFRRLKKPNLFILNKFLTYSKQNANLEHLQQDTPDKFNNKESLTHSKVYFDNENNNINNSFYSITNKSKKLFNSISLKLKLINLTKNHNKVNKLIKNSGRPVLLSATKGSRNFNLKLNLNQKLKKYHLPNKINSKRKFNRLPKTDSFIYNTGTEFDKTISLAKTPRRSLRILRLKRKEIKKIKLIVNEQIVKQVLSKQRLKRKMFVFNKYKSEISDSNLRIRKKKYNKLLKTNKNTMLKKQGPYFQLDKLVKTLPLNFTKKKINVFKSIFIFNFYLWLLALFGLTVKISYANKKIIVIKRKKLIANADKSYISPEMLNYSDENLTDKIYSFRFKNHITLYLIIWKIINIVLAKTNNPLGRNETLLDRNNNVKSIQSIEDKIGFLFKQFKNNFLKISVKNILIKELLAITYIYILTINRFKFTRFLPSLKLLISKLYSKKVELNLVKLKYIHLNTDILSEAISIKLKNKKNSLLKVIKKAFKLVKLKKYENFKLEHSVTTKQNINIEKVKIKPNMRTELVKSTLSINKHYPLLQEQILAKNLHSIDKQNSAVINNQEHYSYAKILSLKNNYHTILNRLFSNKIGQQTWNSGSISSLTPPTSIEHNYHARQTFLCQKYYSKKSKLNMEMYKTLYTAKLKKYNILNNLKYKWITGIKIQGKGRLTRRFTASRAALKSKLKGNFQDFRLKMYGKSWKGLKAPHVPLLRNQVIPNIDHSFGKAKRRIGAFGINVWISSH